MKMKVPNSSKRFDTATMEDKDVVIEDFEEEEILNSLSVKGLKSPISTIVSNGVIDSVNSTPKEMFTVDMNPSIKKLKNTMKKKETIEIENLPPNNNKYTLGRLEEFKVIRKEFRGFMFEVSLDIADALLKLLDVLIFLGIGIFPGVVEEQQEYYYPLIVAFSIDVIIISICSAWRMREIHEMRFLMHHGYSLKWKIGERIVGTSSGSDPRIKRDMKERIKIHKILSVFMEH